jgi:DNA topoisomerase-1
MFAAMRETEYAKNPIFQKNFMDAWRPLLKETPEAKVIKDLAQCDFSLIGAHLDEEKEKKKGLAKEDKAAARAARARQSTTTFGGSAEASLA